MSTVENRLLVHRLFEDGLSTGNMALFDDLIGADFVLHSVPPGLPPDREGFKLLIGAFRSAFPDYHDTVEDLIAEGDRVAVRWTFCGTHQAAFQSIPATGRQVTTIGMSIFRVAGGRIADDWTIMNMVGLLEQLKGAPLPGRHGQEHPDASIVADRREERPMSIEERKAVVRRSLEEGFNALNLAIVDELAAANYVEHMPFPGQAPGPAGVKQLFTMLHTAFPDIQTRIDDIIAEGDKVVVRTTMRGTHQGLYAGVSPTGKQVTISSIAIFRVVGGKIVERWAIGDQLGLLRQLGVVPQAQAASG